MPKKIVKSNEEWRRELTPEQYKICRLKGTEPAFSGTYHDCRAAGVYRCSCCGAELFASDAKFDSGTGWPSFWAPVAPDRVRTERDTGFGMARIEVLCADCDAHLGHLFMDGPAPSYLRYCINSTALDLDPQK